MAGPQGYRDIPEEDRRKAKAFFDRGSTVANTGQFDYAIELFIQGLALDPESVEAHSTLREISLRRKATGGKSLGMLAAMKMRGGKDEREKMLSCEKLLAFDPGNTDHMLCIMENAQKGGYYDTVMWIGPIALKANIDGKNELAKFNKIKEVYIRVEVWDKATEAAQFALAQKPEDMDLQREVKDLAARQTMKRGNYESGGDFRSSIKDMDAQQKLIDADKDIRTEDAMSRMIADAEAEFAAEPGERGKLMKLVELLIKTEVPANDQRAIDLLQQAYERTRQFSYRYNIGQIRIRQMSRMERALRERVNKNREDKELAAEYSALRKEKSKLELDEFTLASENYPTQLEFKYQMAKRLVELENFGEAIPLFQSAVQDPKFRVDATISLGKAFLEAGFVDEAVDTLKGVIDQYQIKGDEKSIDMTYWYGRALEEKEEKQLASKAYSQVAMWNFNYRDVQQRIKAIRGR